MESKAFLFHLNLSLRVRLFMPALSSRPFPPPRLFPFQGSGLYNSSHFDVDKILNERDDDDDELDDMDLQESLVERGSFAFPLTPEFNSSERGNASSSFSNPHSGKEKGERLSTPLKDRQPPATPSSSHLARGKDGDRRAVGIGGRDSANIGAGGTGLSSTSSSSGTGRDGNSSGSGGKSPSANSPLEMITNRERAAAKLGNRDMVSPLQVKRRLRPRPPQRTRSKSGRMVEIDGSGGDKSATDGSSSSRQTQSQTERLHVGVGAGVVRLKEMEQICTQLQKNAKHTKQNGPGHPTAVSVHSKFITIGTSRSLVLVFDHFQEVRQVLGNTRDAEADGAVTAIDVSRGSDFLVCGYKSGRLVLWDIMQGTILKSVTEAHNSPITSVRFWHDKKPYLISIDSLGNVNKIGLNKMFSYYMVETECLLAGAAGQISSLSVLYPLHISVPPSPATHGPRGEWLPHPSSPYRFVAFSSDRNTFVVTVEPEVKVVYKWEQPKGLDDEKYHLASLSWGWVLAQGAGDKPTATLARGWGNRIQLLQVVFQQMNGNGGSTGGTTQRSLSTAILTKAQSAIPQSHLSFLIRHELETAYAVVAVAWLDVQVLVYLNCQNELIVLDTVTMQTMEVVDLSATQLVYATFARQANGSHLDEARSYFNSFQSADGALYLLGRQDLKKAEVQTWIQRVDGLVNDGEWLEALALALDHYEAAVKPLEQKRLVGGARTQGVLRGSVSERIADLLMSYVKLAIANAPGSNSNRGGGAASMMSATTGPLDLVKSHYQMLGRICVEYCVTIQRTDLLFTEIFQRFKESRRTEIFCELLEPYILNGKLSVVSPEVLGDFVQYYKQQGKLTIVEQCIMHLDVTVLDFDSVIRLCRGHDLYSALIYVCNRGLNDYTTPLEVILKAIAAEDHTALALQGIAAATSEPHYNEKGGDRARDYSSLNVKLGGVGLG
jgi:WD40 repeat protein